MDKRFSYSAPGQFVVSVLAVELTLKWNNITGVHSLDSTSQLIPFLFGIGQLCFVVYEGFKNAYEVDFDRIWYGQPEMSYHNAPGKWTKSPLTADPQTITHGK